MNGRTLNDWFTRTVSRLSQTSEPQPPGPAVALAEAISAVPHAQAMAQSAPQTILIVDRERRVVDAGRGVERVLGRSRPDLIGRCVDHVPSLGGRGELESLWPDGTVHRLEFCATVAPFGETQLVALRDVSAEAHPAYPALRDPRQAAAADLRVDEDIAAVLEHAASRVAAALGVDLAGVFVNAGAGRRMLLRAGSGWEPGTVGTATVSGARGAPVGQALTAEDAVAFADLAGAGLPVRPSRLLHEHDVVSGLQVAIWGPQRPWGVLGAYARRTRAFSPDDADFLRVIANTLALALDRARLDERLGRAESSVGEACREAERRTRAQITALLHDEALQSLLAARQQLGRPDRHECVLQARASVQRAIVELRGAVGALHPVAIERQRLRAAIQAVVGHQAKAGGFAAVFALEVEPGEDCAPLLLSVIRELTANIAQHAGAREVGVVLRADGEDLVLEVFDDGVGIPPGRLDAALADGHIGLASMARRVQALDGRLEVLERTPGTFVRVTLPGRVPAAGGAGIGCRGEASV